MADIETNETELPENEVVVEGSDIEVEVVDDAPEEDRGRQPSKEPIDEVTDDELTRYSDKRVAERIKKLGRGFHDERRAKEAAMREREEAMRIAQSVVAENQKLQGSLATNQNALLDQAKKVVAGEIDEAKKAYKEAYEAGDADGVLNAQEQLTAAKIRADRVNNFRPTTVQPPQTVVQPPQPVQQAPVLDAKTREWNERNPWFGQNRKMTAYALSLHEDVVESGVPVASDEYFKRINADIRRRFPEAFEGGQAEAKNSQRGRSNVVAPVSRSTAPRKIVLTQSAANTAKRLNLTLEQYAQAVAELERNK